MPPGARAPGRARGSTEPAGGVPGFNRRELEALGFTRTAVLPIIVDVAEHDRCPDDPDLARRWLDGRTTFVRVGRLAPDKRIEDVVRSFRLCRRINPASCGCCGGARNSGTERPRGG